VGGCGGPLCGGPLFIGRVIVFIYINYHIKVGKGFYTYYIIMTMGQYSGCELAWTHL
jgi:hypothetical protein